MRHPIYDWGSVRSNGRWSKGGSIRERDIDISIAQSGVDEYWCVRENNKEATDLAQNPSSYFNSKHIDVRYHFLRESVTNGDISVQYLRPEDQHPDIRTKPIGREFRKTLRFPVGKGLDTQLYCK